MTGVIRKITHSAIRTDRLASCVLFWSAPKAWATSGETAMTGPEPSIHRAKYITLPRDAAATSSGLIRPIIAVSKKKTKY